MYNAQVNLFGVVTMLAEFLHSGGIATSHRIEPMNLLGYSSSVDAFQIACQVNSPQNDTYYRQIVTIKTLLK